MYVLYVKITLFAWHRRHVLVSSSRFLKISMSISTYGIQMSTFKVYHFNPAVQKGSHKENIYFLMTKNHNDCPTKYQRQSNLHISNIVLCKNPYI